MNADVERARRLLDEATPGPWEHNFVGLWTENDLSGFDGDVNWSANGTPMIIDTKRCPWYANSADADLIAQAPEVLRSLCDRVEELEGQRDVAAALVKSLSRPPSPDLGVTDTDAALTWQHAELTERAVEVHALRARVEELETALRALTDTGEASTHFVDGDAVIAFGKAMANAYVVLGVDDNKETR